MRHESCPDRLGNSQFEVNNWQPDFRQRNFEWFVFGHAWIHNIPTGKFPSITMKNIQIWINIYLSSMYGIWKILNFRYTYPPPKTNLKIPERAIFSIIQMIWTWHNLMELTSIHFSIWQNQKWSSSGYVRTWHLRQIKVFNLNLTFVPEPDPVPWPLTCI